MEIQKMIACLPIELQYYIDLFFDEYRHRFSTTVLPNIPFIERILSRYCDTNEFLYFNINHKRRKHILMNINKTLTILKDAQMTATTLMEFELKPFETLCVKDIWIRVHITSMKLQEYNHLIIETIYINKYNYDWFAIKITTPNVYGGNNANIFFMKADKSITLPNHCNYYSAFHFQHLPECAISKFSEQMPSKISRHENMCIDQ
jgi:hypothetical protein